MTKTSARYSPDARERALRLVLDHQKDHPSQWQWAAIQSIAPKIGCSTETLRNWVRRAERDAGQRPGPTSHDLARLKTLKWENRSPAPPLLPATDADSAPSVAPSSRHKPRFDERGEAMPTRLKPPRLSPTLSTAYSDPLERAGANADFIGVISTCPKIAAQ